MCLWEEVPHEIGLCLLSIGRCWLRLRWCIGPTQIHSNWLCRTKAANVVEAAKMDICGQGTLFWIEDDDGALKVLMIMLHLTIKEFLKDHMHHHMHCWWLYFALEKNDSSWMSGAPAIGDLTEKTGWNQYIIFINRSRWMT